MLVNFEDAPFGIKVENAFGSSPALHVAQTDCPPIAPPRCDSSVVEEKKSSGGAFIPLLKHGRHFVSVSSKELWVLFIQRGDI